MSRTTFTDDGSPLSRARASFTRAYGIEPEFAVRAPGRVNLIGEHTDYNDGFVLPCAIDFHTAVAVRAGDDDRLLAVAEGYDTGPLAASLAEPLLRSADVQWFDYVKAMAWAWRQAGLPLEGVQIAIAGNVPQGAGLSSSAALEVALGLAFRELSGRRSVAATQLALLAQQAENAFVGCHCGNMDQLISAHGCAGHAVLIDCRSLALRPVPLPAEVVVMIVDSQVRRGLVDSEYNTRRRQCEAVAAHFQVPALRDLDLATLQTAAGVIDPVAFRRGRHVVTENARVLEAAEALATGDLPAMGRLMAESHASMRDDFEITVPAIDAIVELVGGVVGSRGGARMTGGGFGGCVVALLPPDLVPTVREALARDYRSPHGQPAAVYACTAGAGAGVAWTQGG